MKYSVTTYSFSQLISAGKLTQLDAVAVAAQIGFDGIEFTELKPCDKPTLEQQLAYAKAIREQARVHGIEIVAYLIGADLCSDDGKEVERVKGQLDVAYALGAKMLRHDVCGSEKRGNRTVSFEQMLPTIAKNAREITEYASTLGIRTMTENHGLVVQDSDRVERLYNAVAHPNYGLLVDIGNFACVDEDSVTAVSRLAPYAIHVHVKDFKKYSFGIPTPDGQKAITTRGCNKLIGCAIGDGDIPVSQCLSIIKRTAYDAYLTVEFEGPNDCLCEIRRGLDYLKENT